MNKVYDLLTEPWISVRDNLGQLKRLGILETLFRADELAELTYSNPLEEFSVYRFLCVFLMDALRPESIEDIENYLDAGKFSEDEIIGYTRKCMDEGVSFNLFDETKPFMQAVPEKDTTKLKTAAYLDYTLATGNNPVHFDHGSDDFGIPFQDIMPKILACQLFATAQTQGYPSSINDAPPYFAVIKGQSLFETLCRMLVPIEEINISFDDPPVYWRRKKEMNRDETEISWMLCMLYPARKISVVPDWESQSVKYIYFSQGSNIKDHSSWTDPDVAYRFSDSGRFPLRPAREKPIWRNLTELIDTAGKSSPVIINLFRRMMQDSDTVANVTLYGVETSNASHLEVLIHDLQIPVNLIGLDSAVDFINECIAKAESAAKAISGIFHSKELSVKLESIQHTCVQNFYQDCENALWVLCGMVTQVNDDNYTKCESYWVSSIETSAKRRVNESINALQLPSSQLVKIYKNQLQLMNYLRKIKKEGDLK